VHRSGTRREDRLVAEPEERERRAKFRASLTGELVEDGERLIGEASLP
jgi:hypothetical protein